MAGLRPNHPRGLRLVHDEPADASAAGDGRPVVLHAIGSPRERLLLSALVAELRGTGQMRQVVVEAGPELDLALAGVPGLALADRRIALPEDLEPTERLAALMAAYEEAVDAIAPDLVVVAGEGDAGLAAALAAARRGVAVAHVESGVRHPRRADLHRLLDDRIADTLLAPTATDAAHLAAEGIPDTRVHVVGRTDVDVLRPLAPRARARRLWEARGLQVGGYLLLSLPAGRLADPGTAAALDDLARRVPVTHLDADRVMDRLSLLAGCGGVITDDGDLQDLASALGVPCHTPGNATDRPHTVTAGTNRLLGDDLDALRALVPAGPSGPANDMPPWDGRAAQRAAAILVAHYVLASPVEATAR